jgi:hypothetical protein
VSNTAQTAAAMAVAWVCGMQMMVLDSLRQVLMRYDHSQISDAARIRTLDGEKGGGTSLTT